jgi:hypothetical protein
MTKRWNVPQRVHPFTLEASYQMACYDYINRGPWYAKIEEAHCNVMLFKYSWRNHFGLSRIAWKSITYGNIFSFWKDFP